MEKLTNLKDETKGKVVEIIGDIHFQSRITSIGVTVGSEIEVIQNYKKQPEYYLKVVPSSTMKVCPVTQLAILLLATSLKEQSNSWPATFTGSAVQSISSIICLRARSFSSSWTSRKTSSFDRYIEDRKSVV